MLRTMLGLVGVLGLVVAMVADAAWITVFEAAIVGAMLGEIVWLMSQPARTSGRCAPGHKQFFISDLEWLAAQAAKTKEQMTPVLLQQFRLFYAQDRPLGVVPEARKKSVLWGQVSDEVEKRLVSRQPKRPTPASWWTLKKSNAYLLAERAIGGEGEGTSIFIFWASWSTTWSTTCRQVPFRSWWSVAAEPSLSLRHRCDVQLIDIINDPVAQLDRAPAF